MAILREGDLEFSFDGALHAAKFDDAKHGISHAMKAVDFIVEYEDYVLFVEVKDPDHPAAPDAEKSRFIQRLKVGTLEDDLIKKYRDSFLYRWSEHKVGKKPIDFAVVIALSKLTPPLLVTRTDSLKRQLPSLGKCPSRWKRCFVRNAGVYTIESWNRYGKFGSVRRISLGA